MSKYTSIILLFVVGFAAVAIADDDDFGKSDDSGFFSFGHLFSGVGKTLGSVFGGMGPPDSESHSYSQSSNEEHSETIINGKKVKKSDRTDNYENDDGKITEKHTVDDE